MYFPSQEKLIITCVQIYSHPPPKLNLAHALLSPLVKTLPKKKSRLSCNNKEQLATSKRLISELICENRTHLAAPVGSGRWWKTVDDITQRHTHSNSVVLDKAFANQLNDYFHEL